ncbi:MAG: hypothetical protein RL007_737, partial [Bacteroidota bacterium]
MKVEIGSGFYISLPQKGDEGMYVKLLNDPYIFARTLMLPA